jgi:hypothetical protein
VKCQIKTLLLYHLSFFHDKKKIGWKIKAQILKFSFCWPLLVEFISETVRERGNILSSVLQKWSSLWVFISKRGLKGDRILEFCIFGRHISGLSFEACCCRNSMSTLYSGNSAFVDPFWLSLSPKLLEKEEIYWHSVINSWPNQFKNAFQIRQNFGILVPSRQFF